MYTEKEAWLKLVEWRRQPKGSVALGEDNPNELGLCYDIICLGHYNLIDKPTHDSMFDKLYQFGNSPERTHFGIYYWPSTPEGDEERIKFCLRQAESLTV